MIALGQFGAVPDKNTNLCAIERMAEQAAKNGASMLFLPEYSMFYAKTTDRSLIARSAESLHGPFVQSLGALARQHNLWIAAGLYEAAPGLPYNTIAVVDDTGALRAHYRKRQLYDAFGYRESDECRAGHRAFRPLDTPAGKLGVITCFELRFAALAAQQRQAGAQTLFIPAGWMQGTHKLLHWQTLLRARAIENNMMVLGVNQTLPNTFIGHSAAFAPTGEMLGSLEQQTSLLFIPTEKR